MVAQLAVGRVSVIVLTFNSENFVARCLSSLVEQTYKNFEVLIVDGGSLDRTREITRLFESRLSIRWLSAPDTSMGEARNVGIRAAAGEFLAYCDSDDLFRPKKLEANVKVMLANPECDVVYGPAAHFRTQSPDREYLSRKQFTGSGILAAQFVRAQTININSILVRRQLGRDVFFPEGSEGKYGEDWQYLINLCIARLRFKFDPGIYSLIEVRVDSHTSWNIQHLMKWYVIAHIVRNKKTLLALGCPATVFRYHVFKHWLKFAISCVASGRPDFPKTVCFKSLGGMPWVMRLYTYVVRPIFSRLIPREVFRQLWLMNRQLKERRIRQK